MSIDLSSNKLTGAFPYTLLLLPELRTLNVSDNQLTGDMAQGMTAFAESSTANGDAVAEGLTTLNVSNNQLSGNIGLVASYLPKLTSLNASKNGFDAVYPMISEQVTNLDIKGQTISKVTSLDLSDLADGSVTDLPNILLYRHEAQTFASDVRMCLEQPAHDWSMVMALGNGGLNVPFISEQNVYYGTSGDVLSAKLLDGSNRETGDMFTISLRFDNGDANFNGEVDVIDLQAIINYIFDNYREQPFSFTASDLDIAHDQIINVLDVVGMVNLLMEMTPAANAMAFNGFKVRQRAADGNVSFNSIIVHDGKLILEANTPVAAFDIVIDGVTTSHVSSLKTLLANIGMTCMIQQQGERVHVIGYSLAGATLPIGQTVLCSLERSDAKVVYAKLSDINANEIKVSLEGNGDATGIADVRSQTEDGIFYNLAGQRISKGQLKSGLYIVNGKKTIYKKK